MSSGSTFEWSPAPLGVSDLEVDAADRYSLRATEPLCRPNEIRCCVRSCDHWLAKRRRAKIRDDAFCSAHNISVSTKPTYVYRDRRRNFIVGLELLASLHKVESWRLGHETSEDALSWNVFVALSRLGGLRSVFETLTGESASADPELYLWGNRVDAALTHFWDSLLKVRRELERGLAIPTEPDIILRVPGQAIVLVEAKFGSPNGTLARKQDRRGTVPEFLQRYRCRDKRPDPLHRNWIASQDAGNVLEQLCRNVIFAQWLAEEKEKPFVVNLVCEKDQQDVVFRFRQHLAEGVVAFRRASWEQIASLPVIQHPNARPLHDYLANKTLNLQKAFNFA